MNSSVSNWVNQDVFKKSRHHLGLTQDNVVEQSKQLDERLYKPIDADQLRSWETGTQTPKLEQLETLSEIYICPVGYFFMDNLPAETQKFSYRGLAANKEETLKPLSRQTLQRFLELAEWTVNILDELNIEWAVNIPKMTQETAQKDFDELIKQERNRFGFSPDIRKSWLTANDAFTWWRNRLESLGVFCFQMKLEYGDVRGSSLWLEPHIPFVLVNQNDVEAAPGRIFTLLHEYAHLIINKGGLVCDFRGNAKNDNPEPFANRFAARMLLTYEELQHRLGELGIKEKREVWADTLLDTIRNPLSVSRDVVAIMLQEMNLAPKGFYQKKRPMWENRKPGGRGAGGCPKKVELTFRRIGYSLASVLTQKAGINSLSLTDLSYVLDMKVEKLDEFFTWTQDKLNYKV